MSKLTVFKRQASIGSSVTLRLTRGNDITGQITEINDIHVCLIADGRTVTIFEDILAGWEIHQSSPSRIDANTQVPASPEPEPEEVAAPSSVAELDIRAVERLAKIKATFAEGLKHAHLVSPEPDFQFAEQEFPPPVPISVRRDWDKARNQYGYAVKVKELSRLSTIIAQVLQPLAKNYPGSSSIKGLLACLLLKIGRTTEALEYFQTAAILSKAPGHWYGLAFTAPTGSALQCLALRNYLLAVQSIEAREAWFCYLAVTFEQSDMQGLKRLIEHWVEQAKDSALSELLAETIIYTLGQLGQHDEAQQAVIELASASGISLPEKWEEVWSKVNLTSPPEITALEQQLSNEKKILQPEYYSTSDNSSKKGPTVHCGRITSFRNQNFGFIEESGNGQVCFFRMDDVISDKLRQALIDDSWKYQPDVEFEVVPSLALGDKYLRAVQIAPPQSPEDLLKRARQLQQISQFSQAIALLRRVYTTMPDHPEAHRLEEDMLRRIRVQGLPKGSGPYAKAKRAQMLDGDLKEAERLFRLAIQQQDKTESAVKDLAALLQQQARSDEAIKLLESRRRGFRGVSPYDNMLATIYQHVGRHDEAITLLEQIIASASKKDKPNLMHRVTFSHFKSGRYDQAEKTLRKLLEQAPQDRIAERWLAGLEEARDTGSYANAEEIIGVLSEEGIELSPLAREAIETCTFEGMDLKKIQTGTITIKDVEKLEDLARRRLGWQVPRERAAYYLSAAAILQRFIQEVKNTSRIHRDLRRYFVSMGDAAWADQKPADVVRTYYLESLALVPSASDEETEEWLTLVQYHATFVPDQLKDLRETFFRTNHRSAIQASLTAANQTGHGAWWHALLELCTQSPFGARAFWEVVAVDASLRTSLMRQLGLDTVIDIATLERSWRNLCWEHTKTCQQRTLECLTLTRHQLTAASMEELEDRLRQIAKTSLWELDKRRLSELADIAQSALAFCRTSDFEDKEQQYWLVTTRAKAFVDQVRTAPTQFANEALLPIAEHLSALTEEGYAQIALTSTPKLDLSLLTHNYFRGREGDICLQIAVSNKPGCSPASSVRVAIGPRDSPYFTTSRTEWEIVSTLRGGSSEDGHVYLIPSDHAVSERVFPIKIQAYYCNRLGENCSTDEIEETVRLYDDNEFQKITNYYMPYAEGGEVDNPKMFVGRDELLARLENSLLASAGSKSIVIYGQKRAGKSSVLEHLKRRLAKRPECVPIKISVQEAQPNLSEAAFLHLILRDFANTLEDLRLNGRSVPALEFPSLVELQTHPSLRFHDVMSALQRQMRCMDGTLTFVLLIDEFTDIYKQIRKDKLAPEFMKAWKSIIEKRYFSSVLVGQDIMPAFEDAFPNELAVSEDVRVTYLAEADAKRLIQEPIGANRYAGKAVERILDLTARSPYYTMMLCSRLVDYMNRTRSAIVTEADIANVEQEMLIGSQRLADKNFDGLISAGDGKFDSGIDPEQTRRLCSTIAKSANRGWCARDSIREFDKNILDFLLDDLVKRDVVERKGDTYRLCVGLFHDWLLVQG